MRKGFALYTVIAIVLFLTACSNKLNVLAPYKNITVVYGLLDQNDTAHYVRINKAYEGPGNAITMARQFDSVYYPANQLLVQLQVYNSQNALAQTITLTPDSSIPLQSGTFTSPKQILYKTKAKLNVLDQYGFNYQYNLYVKNLHTQQVLTGSTQLLTDVTFTAGLSGMYIPMSFFATAPSNIQWTSTVGGRIYQMTMRFYYHEITATDDTEKYIDWVFPTQTASTLLGGESLEYSYTAQQFLQFIRASIPIVNSAQRTADSIQVIFTSGSDDFNTYIQLSQPTLGIDPDQPSFSDVKNGVGIFTSRHTQEQTELLNGQTIDSIVNSPSMLPYDFRI
ncbi:MAG: hypothetical protein ACLQQ4_16185 [Bacteroidia bacterium]